MGFGFVGYVCIEMLETEHCLQLRPRIGKKRSVFRISGADQFVLSEEMQYGDISCHATD